MRRQRLNTPKIMNREKLISAISQIANDAGYAFFLGDKTTLASEINSLPALWLMLPQLLSKQGRSSGKITYDVKLLLLKSGRKSSPQERAAQWNQAESELLELFSALSRTPAVIEVQQLKIAMSKSIYTQTGEIAAEATAQVVTYF